MKKGGGSRKLCFFGKEKAAPSSLRTIPSLMKRDGHPERSSLGTIRYSNEIRNLLQKVAMVIRRPSPWVTKEANRRCPPRPQGQARAKETRASASV